MIETDEQRTTELDLTDDDRDRVPATDSNAQADPEAAVPSPRAAPRAADIESTRVDRWLSAARIYKSRSQAQKACEAGHVTVNDVKVKASRALAVGDRIVARAPRGLITLIVRDIEEKRQSSVRAKQLYEDRTPIQTGDRDQPMAVRERGAGRPTKADRRAIARLTGFDGDD